MSKDKSSEYLIFNSTGVPDKEIAAVAVVSSLKEVYTKEKIIVISTNPEVWLHNPDVYRVYRIGTTPYFYEDYVRGKSSKIFWQDPFSTNDFIHKKKNLIEAWCELCKVKWNKKEPKLYFTFREFEATKRMMEQNIALNLRQSLCANQIRTDLLKSNMETLKTKVLNK